MVSSELAVVAVCAVLLVALFAASAVAGWSARSRAADAELALEARMHAEQRKRAEQAEEHARKLSHVGREYLALVPAGGGRVDRGRLLQLLDATEQYVAAPPGPAAQDGVSNSPAVG